MDFDDLLNGYNARSKIKLNETSNSNSSNNMWGAILSAIAGLVGSVMQNTNNTKQIQATNQANRELVQMQNKASAQEAEKAYQRSLPINQVNTMQAAGMSKAGAINALNGGGSYQPAPVNASQDTAPQVDYTTAINAMQSFASLQEQKRQFNAQHQLAQRQQAFEEKKYKDAEGLRSAELRSALAAAGIAESEDEIYKVEAEIQKARKNGRLSAEKLKDVADMAAAVLAKFRDDKIYNAMHKLTPEEIENLFEMQAYMSMIEHGIKHDAMNAVYEGAKKLGSLLVGGKTAGRYIRTY